MNIVILSPGAGAMYCGNCLRDNALVAALRTLGHQVTMVPLYLPLTLDEPNQSTGTPLFFSGINVFLEQSSRLFRSAPRWFHRLMQSPALLNLAARRAGSTRPSELGDLTFSMLQGEEGNQTRELDELVAWLKDQPQPDVVCLSNALLTGMARRLKAVLNVPVICWLQGEDSFLDHLPETHRQRCWDLLAQRAVFVDRFISPSQYFADVMRRRFGWPEDRIQVIHNGINLAGYPPLREQRSRPSPEVPTVGYFARMCREKGLDTLVEAYLTMRREGRLPACRLKIGGSCGPTDQPLVDALRQRLDSAGLLGETEFCPNLTRSQKIEFLKSLSVFSVPARYGEAFGLYVVEALAAGTPVVQPRAAAFPELVEATGGGVTFEPENSKALAEVLTNLLLDPVRREALGQAGREAVFDRFSAQAMALGHLQVFAELSACASQAPPVRS